MIISGSVFMKFRHPCLGFVCFFTVFSGLKFLTHFSQKHEKLSCILASHQHIYNNAYYCIPITSMARFYEGCTNHILPFYFTNKVSHSIVSLELILGFNVQAQSSGSMIRFDVEERDLKHW